MGRISWHRSRHHQQPGRVHRRANRPAEVYSRPVRLARSAPRSSALDPDGSVIVGEAARRRLLTQPERTIYSVKRLMGRGPADVQNELALFPFRIDPKSKTSFASCSATNVYPAGNFRLYPPRIAQLGRSRTERTRRSRRHHRARLLQRRPAPGHQRRRPHRRPRSPSPRQ